MKPSFGSLALVVLFVGAASARQGAEPDSLDPAPPAVQQLEPLAPPEAQAPPGREHFAAPRPLADGARRADWPGFLGPRRDGICREAPLALDFGPEGPPLLWTFERGEGYAAPAILGERLVVTHRVGDEVFVECLQAETGLRFWRRAFPCRYRGRYIENGGPRATPLLTEDRVYVHGVDGRLSCLELATGRTLWERNPERELGVPEDFFGVVASPLLVGDALIQNVGAKGGRSVVAFDRETGRILWTAGEEWGPSCASPVVVELGGRPKLLVLAGGDSRPPTGGLLVIDLERRAVDARFPFRSRTYESVNGATPVLAGETIFLTASYGVGSVGLGLTEASGLEERWRDRRLALEFATPVYADGVLYGIDGTRDGVGALFARAPADGRELWRTNLEFEATLDDGPDAKPEACSVGVGAVLGVPGALLVLGDRGHLLVVEPGADGARLRAHATPFLARESWTPPVVAHGLLYLCQNHPDLRDGAPARLWCFDLRGGS